VEEGLTSYYIFRHFRLVLILVLFNFSWLFQYIFSCSCTFSRPRFFLGGFDDCRGGQKKHGWNNLSKLAASDTVLGDTFLGFVGAEAYH
jgi:hypothetical protein